MEIRRGDVNTGRTEPNQLSDRTLTDSHAEEFSDCIPRPWQQRTAGSCRSCRTSESCSDGSHGIGGLLPHNLLQSGLELLLEVMLRHVSGNLVLRAHVFFCKLLRTVVVRIHFAQHAAAKPKRVANSRKQKEPPLRAPTCPCTAVQLYSNAHPSICLYTLHRDSRLHKTRTYLPYNVLLEFASI